LQWEKVVVAGYWLYCCVWSSEIHTDVDEILLSKGREGELEAFCLLGDKIVMTGQIGSP
jgi:hypothetical protein